jgi:uncharacterized protein GlcG (DUF336 family)
MINSTHEISLELCLAMYKKAEEKAKEIGLNIVFTVLDKSGNVKFYAKMDNTILFANKAAIKKAFTAIGFGMPTGAAWYDFIKDDPILMNGVDSLENFSLLGGGKPLIYKGEIIGGIGISGGHYSQDEIVCNAAYEVFESL